MTGRVVGIDYSTVRIDACAVSLDGDLPPRFASHALPTRRRGQPLNAATRCHDAAWALRSALEAVAPPGTILCVAIEEPWGRYRGADRAMLPILGALTIATPYPVAWYSPDAWRDLAGAPKRSKAACHAYLQAIDARLASLDGDQLDAYGVALAHRAALLAAA